MFCLVRIVKLFEVTLFYNISKNSRNTMHVSGWSSQSGGLPPHDHYCISFQVNRLLLHFEGESAYPIVAAARVERAISLVMSQEWFINIRFTRPRYIINNNFCGPGRNWTRDLLIPTTSYYYDHFCCSLEYVIPMHFCLGWWYILCTHLQVFNLI